VGPIDVSRTYFTCPDCGQGDFGADHVLGIDGYLTAGAQRMACLAGVRQSFGLAEQLLAELAGWKLDEETIRRLCHAVAAQATATREQRATAEQFSAAAGDLEVQIDAGKVNTLEGWRDVKFAVFARRQRGKPACAQEWKQRDLPAPTVRSVVAAIEEAELFGGRCVAEANRLSLTDPSALNVLADGGEWIWNLAEQRFPGAAQNLDIYHGAEHLADAARCVFGVDSLMARTQADRATIRLLEDGYCGVVEWIGEISSQIPAGSDGASLGATLNYLAGHQERLRYALRLRRGQSIGSGMVEGSIKQLLNRRLKQTGARWKTQHVGPFVELHALANGPEWNTYWNN
jgi:ribosomal protein S27AE